MSHNLAMNRLPLTSHDDVKLSQLLDVMLNIARFGRNESLAWALENCQQALRRLLVGAVSVAELEAAMCELDQQLRLLAWPLDRIECDAPMKRMRAPLKRSRRAIARLAAAE